PVQRDLIGFVEPREKQMARAKAHTVSSAIVRGRGDCIESSTIHLWRDNIGEITVAHSASAPKCGFLAAGEPDWRTAMLTRWRAHHYIFEWTIKPSLVGNGIPTKKLAQHLNALGETLAALV